MFGTIEQGEQGKRKSNQNQRQLVGITKLQGFNMIINGNRHYSGLVLNIAANHQNYTEFAKSVSKTQTKSADQSGLAEWEDHTLELFKFINAK